MAKTESAAKSDTASTKKSQRFTDEEKAAMQQRAKELKTEERRKSRTKKGKADGETEVIEAIAKMQEPDRSMAERLHEIIKANAPDLSPKTWYGMPAYANKDGDVVCFFQPAQKFKTRYGTLGFNNSAKLDDGSMWPVAYALTKVTATEEARIAALVKKAVG